MPPDALTMLLQTPDLRVLAEPLPSDGREEQWIGRVVVTTNAPNPKPVVEVRIKRHLPWFNRTTAHPNGFESLDVTLEWFKPYPRLRVLPAPDTYFVHSKGIQVHAGRLRHLVQEVDVRVPRRELVLVTCKFAKVAIFSSSAHEYFGFNGVHQHLGRKYAHLDVDFLDMHSKELFEGVLPELWGYRPLSDGTRAMVKHPPVVQADESASSETV